jgi:signal peptidase
VTVTATGPLRRSRSREKTFWHYLGVAGSATLLIFVLGIAALAIVVPAAVGGSALTVLTQSMEPRLPPGTLIIIRPTPIDDIHVGDVITYQIEPDEPAVISHRVISRTTDDSGHTTFITRGDNNDLADAKPVTPVQVRGTLWYSLPLLGYVNNFVGSQNRAWLVPTVAGALFVYAIVMVISWARGRRRAARVAPDLSDM